MIIGNGMAAARLVQNLSARALGRYAIAVVGDEPRLAYNRVMLSSVLAGEMASRDIDLQAANWWRDRGVTLRYGQAATAVDLTNRNVTLADGVQVTYSKLVFATGSQPVRLPVPGAHLTGVHTFRDSRDVDLLLALAEQKKRAVVIGGGLLGLEAAYGLACAGSPVVLLHLMDRLMERQLDADAASLLRVQVEHRGIDVRLSASTTEILGNKRVEGIRLADGTEIATDAVVFSAGVRPNAGLAQASGVGVNRGIVVDDHMAADTDEVYAIGECAEHRGICYGLVEPTYEQASVLGDVLLGRRAAYEGSILSTNLKVSGCGVFSAGDFMGADGTEILVFNDRSRGIYKKLVMSGNRLAGAVLIGDTEDAVWYLSLIRSGSDIGGMRSDIMFGPAIAERKAA